MYAQIDAPDETDALIAHTREWNDRDAGRFMEEYSGERLPTTLLLYPGSRIGAPHGREAAERAAERYVALECGHRPNARVAGLRWQDGRWQFAVEWDDRPASGWGRYVRVFPWYALVQRLGYWRVDCIASLRYYS